MRIAILGSGDLGGAVAHALARRGEVSEITLVDSAAGAAAGKALDILQSGPIERFATRLTGTGDPAAAVGAEVAVVCDRATQPPVEWQGDQGLAMLRQLSSLGARPPLVFAGSLQRTLMLQAAVDLGWPRQRLVGSAPDAMAAALRAMVAVEADCSPADVAVAVTGVPGVRLVISWNDATIGGQSLPRVLSPVAMSRLDARAARLWPPGPYALAAAAARVVEALVIGSRHRFTGFAVLDGELGVRGRVAAVPLALAAGGHVRALEPSLDARARVAFDIAVDA